MTPGSPALLAALPAFAVGRLPRIVFGAGRRTEIPSLVVAFGHRALLVTGARSLRTSPAWTEITAGLDEAGVAWEHLAIDGEPSPELVDGAVATRRHEPPDVVVGIGGGSALDAAKAIAGLLRSGTVALDHLEGVGRGIRYPGPSTPFLAVPTTAGTGSEATRNAVLSGRGDPKTGRRTAPYKKSFRDDRLVAAVAVVDPDLLIGCPPVVIAGDGLDALTQCLGGIRLDRRVALHGRDRPERALGDRACVARVARGGTSQRRSIRVGTRPDPRWHGQRWHQASRWRTPGLGPCTG